MARAKLVVAIMLFLSPLAVAGFAAPVDAHAAAPMRDVLLVGNNWDGTVDVIDVGNYKRLDRINVVPDLEQRKSEIFLNPVDAFWFTAVQQAVGEGHDQLVDDVFSSGDGRRIFVSRPSLADVVAIDLASHKIVWRTHVDGNRADHMAISPDHTRLLVSASTTTLVDVIDTSNGKIVGTFPSGDSPHENNYSKDGKLIYHASIGRVYVPANDPASDQAKGKRIFEIVDAHTLKVLRTFDISQKLAAFGRPGMSPAIRPMALSPDERFLYVQLSFFHGLVEYDLKEDKVTRVLDLPKLSDNYVLNSAHHGLQMNPEGTKLCVAGTIDNYAAIVDRRTFAYKTMPVGERPYWANNSADGRYCYLSIAGEDRIAVISYERAKEVASIPVGDHPQRNRDGKVAADIYGPAPTAPAGRMRARALSLRAAPARDRHAPFRFALRGRLVMPPGIGKEACTGTVKLTLRRGRLLAGATARLRRGRAGCRYAKTVQLRGRRRLRTGPVTARARYSGNDFLFPRRSRVVRLRAG